MQHPCGPQRSFELQDVANPLAFGAVCKAPPRHRIQYGLGTWPRIQHQSALRRAVERTRLDNTTPSNPSKANLGHGPTLSHTARASQLFLGELAELVRNGACDPKQAGAISDGVASKAIANGVDRMISKPSRRPGPGTRPPNLIDTAE